MPSEPNSLTAQLAARTKTFLATSGLTLKELVSDHRTIVSRVVRFSIDH